MGASTNPWTAGAHLPGGNVAVDGIDALRLKLKEQIPFADDFTIRRLIRQYGTQCHEIFGAITSPEQLGESFGHGVTAFEIDWAIENEWVHSADDFLWRRSKMGIRFKEEETAALNTYIKRKMKGS